MLQKGTCLNGLYTLIEPIGSGGIGVVYKAYHENLKKYVVVKQIKDVVKNVINSRVEVDILKNLHNSYLPQVYDFIELDGDLFTVIDYIEGESMDRVLKRVGRFSQKDVLKWGRQLAEALSYLHSRVPPVIHSDIKPANIMLMPDGDICLIDFNVSMVFDKNLRRSAGVSRGFSPPEQYPDYTMYRRVAGIGPGKAERKAGSEVRGKASVSPQRDGTINASGIAPTEVIGIDTASGYSPNHNSSKLTLSLLGKGIDERSDVYSLGATLYAILTGISPSADFEAIIPVSKLRLPVSEGLSVIIEKMMTLSPDQRYQNGTEVLNAFRNIREMDSVYRAYRRRRLINIGVIAALFVSGAGLIFAGLNLMQREQSNRYYNLVAEAETLIGSGDYDGADTRISEALNEMPERIDAYRTETLRLYSSGDYEGCINYATSAINSPEYFIEDDNDRASLSEIMYIMGNAYFELEEYDNAARSLEMAISNDDSNGNYYRDLGIIYAKAGNLSEAQAILDDAESHGFGEDSIYMLEAEIASSEGSFVEAIDLFKEAISLTQSAETRRRCVSLCIKAYEDLGNDYTGEEIAFIQSQMSGRDADDTEYLEDLGEAYAARGDYAQALSCFTRLRDQGLVTYQLLQNISILYQQTGELEQAENTLNEMLESYPGRYETYKRLAFLEADKQQRLANDDRDYYAMRDYYNEALSLYEEAGGYDAEMEQLNVMMQELEDGNWFNE